MSTESGFLQGQEAEYKRWLHAFEMNGCKLHPGISPRYNLAEVLREECKKERERILKRLEEVPMAYCQEVADELREDAKKS
jgi:hypothetical protein